MDAFPEGEQLSQVLREQWSRGDRVLVENFLSSTAGNNVSTDALIELILTEYQLRQESGETPEVSEYQHRFPELQERLQRLLPLMNDDNESITSDSREHASSADETTYIGPVAADVDSQRQSRDAEDLLKKSPTIGPYKLLQQIGQGGMGSVFMAEQDKPVRRRVALKLIKLGMDSRDVITRFEAERQALAMMDHQNIAKVLDAGTTNDGRPYFVMELVNGIPITDYCDKFKLALNDRLGLFSQACKAIQHAHQKGIIHRDIKPSNVLVTQHDGVPVVKVIDFGLAKALQSGTRLTDKTMFTEFGQVVGTLQYMSPEQAELNALDVDTRSDVYSLGVLLYELLTGSTPIEKQTLKEMALDRVLAAIREQEPPRPSFRLSSAGTNATGISEQRRTDPRRLSLILKGDLDWIAMKALEKDRTRRYDSPAQLAEDVQRYLNSEAIIARPPSVSYRLRKTLRKHRVAVGTSLLVMLSLITGLIGTATMWRQAVEAKQAALNEKTKAQQIAEQLDEQSKQATKARDEARIAAASEAVQRKAAEELLYSSNLQLADIKLREGAPGFARMLLEATPERMRKLEYMWLSQKADESVRVIEGHSGPVQAVILSADGQRLRTCSADSTHRIWNTATGEQLHMDNSYCHVLTQSPDSAWIAGLDSSGIVQLWTGFDDVEPMALPELFGDVLSLAFSPDSRILAAGNRKGRLTFWDLAEARIIQSIDLPKTYAPGDRLPEPDPISWIAWSHDGGRLAVIGERFGSPMRILDTQTWEFTARFAPTETVDRDSFERSLWLPTGLLAVTTADGTLCVLDPVSGEVHESWQTNIYSSTMLPLHDGQDILLTGRTQLITEGRIEIRGKNIAQVRALTGHSAAVNSASASRTGLIATGSDDGSVRLWETQHPLMRLDGMCTIRNDRVICLDKSEFVRWIDRDSGQPVGEIQIMNEGNVSSVLCRAVNASGSLVALGSYSQGKTSTGRIQILDMQHLEERKTIEIPGYVNALDWSSDSSRLLACSGIGVVYIFDAESGQPSEQFSIEATSAAFSPAADQFVAVSALALQCVFQNLDGNRNSESVSLPSRPRLAVYSPSGDRVLIVGEKGLGQIYETETRRVVVSLQNNSDDPWNAVWNHDGTRVATVGSKGLRIWDATNGKELVKVDTTLANEMAFDAESGAILFVDAGLLRWAGKRYNRGTANPEMDERILTLSPAEFSQYASKCPEEAMERLAAQRIPAQLAPDIAVTLIPATPNVLECPQTAQQSDGGDWKANMLLRANSLLAEDRLDEAIDQLNNGLNGLEDTEPATAVFCGLRAIAYARQQRMDASQGDMMRMSMLLPDSIAVRMTSAVIKAWSDDLNSAMLLLEDAATPASSGADLYNVACAWSQLAKAARRKNNLSMHEMALNRAMDVLRFAMSRPDAPTNDIGRDPDLAPLFDQAEFSWLLWEYGKTTAMTWKMHRLFREKSNALFALANQKQWDKLRQLSQQDPDVIRLFRAELTRPVAQDSGYRRMSVCLIALHHLNADDWPLLFGHAINDRVRHWTRTMVREFEVPAAAMIDGFYSAIAEPQKAWFVQAIGEYSPDALDHRSRQLLLDEVRKTVTESSGNPALNAACRWMLRKWQLLPSEDQKLPHMRQVALRVEPGRPAPPTSLIEMSETEVTRFQYHWILDPMVMTENGDFPMTDITREEAAEWCNKLSERAGIAQDQWCYEKVSLAHMVTREDGQQITVERPAYNLRAQYPELTGFRLPTEAEWRAAAEMSYLLADGQVSDPLFRSRVSADETTWGQPGRAGGRVPDSNGIMDLFGSVDEICEFVSASEMIESKMQMLQQAEPSDFSELMRNNMNNHGARPFATNFRIAFDGVPLCPVLGGNYSLPAWVFGSIPRRVERSDTRSPVVGFRVVRSVIVSP